MKIYTKRGDGGTTSLYSGERVSKTDIRIHTLGHIDELTSNLGKLKCIMTDNRIINDINRIQTNLIKFMGIVAGIGDQNIGLVEEETSWIEGKIDLYSKEYIHPGRFILPGENEISAQSDVTRTIARRAERSLHECDNIPDKLKEYINRLSDYLYTVARVIEAGMKKANKMINTEVGMSMLLEEAKQLIKLIEEYARYQECNVSIAVTNKDGNPICVESMDGSLMVSFELAIKKAYTAAALQMPSHELAKLTQDGAPFAGLENMLDKQIVTIGGGWPLIRNGQLIGAIGVSGGTASQDIDIASYGHYVWEGNS